MDQDPNQNPAKNIGDAGDTNDKTTNTAPETETIQLNQTPTQNQSQPTAKIPIEDQKASRVPIIVLSILAVVVLILGSIGIWFYGFYNNPANVAKDAVLNLLSAPHVSLDGGVAVMPLDDEDSQLLLLNLNSATNGSAGSSTASLLVTFDDEHSINLQLGTVQLSDGVIYLQISKIMESIDRLNLDQDDRDELEEILGFLEVVDNEWWRISIPDLIDGFELDQDMTSGLKEFYTCAVDMMNSDISGELSQLYKRLPFVDVTEVKEISDYAISGGELELNSQFNAYTPAFGNNLYEISLNRTNLANFINALPETEAANSFYRCYNNAMDKYFSDDSSNHISATDFDEIDADDIRLTDDQHFYMEVSQFGHQIQSLHFYQSEQDYVTSAAVSLKYDNVAISAPENYRPITDLVDELIELFVTVTYPEYYDPYLEDDPYPEHFGNDYNYDELI